MKKIILASASPRRKEILKITGLKFRVCASDHEEEFDLSLKPHRLARFLSRKKAEAVARKFRKAIIIAADTFIYFENNLLGKPRTGKEAEKMLGLLSGKVHSVITGFTILDTESGQIVSQSVVTKVHFRSLDKEEIRDYIRSGEPFDKAGAYAAQGLGAVFIEKIEGDFFNVMGLPLCALTEGLKKFGVDVFKQ
jgi:septum formation protein